MAVVAAAIAVGCIAGLVVSTLPVFLSVIGRARGLSEAHVGLIALADAGGIAVGSTICALFAGVVQSIGWRRAAAAGLTAMIVANLLAGEATTFVPLLAARGAAGLGAGVVMAISYATLGEGEGARELGLFNIVQVGSGWLAAPLLTPIVYELGVAGMFRIVAALAAAGLLVCLFLPRAGRPQTNSSLEHGPSGGLSFVGGIAVFSILAYFTGAGAVFGFLGFMGVAWGGAPMAVEAALYPALFAAMLAGVAAAVIGSRIANRTMLWIGYTAVFASLTTLAVAQPVAEFALIAALFGFSWNLLAPFQFAAVTKLDPSPAAAMLVGAATLGGLAIGPAIAGQFISPNYVRVNVGALVACAASAVFLHLAFAARARVATESSSFPSHARP